ncbi:MAG: acyltransferase family protein [Streptosporangiales bacterium]|nr:acyltransferase family protein [Streptosporangiales bacterium]
MSAPTPRPDSQYMPGIDGLRALSVLAVIGYHLDIPLLRGGFLGVDTFFVISGFLITDLLFNEWRDHGRVDLKAFWVRRARRLLPALWLLLAAVAAVVTVIGGDVGAGLRGNVAAALAYVSNWWQVAEQTSYVAQFGPPPPLLHLWSLAVEEQFYLVWPLLLVGLVRVLRSRQALAAVALLAAAGSIAWMWVTFQPGTDPSRAYYGTDTHAFGLLLGAALALGVGSRRLRLASTTACEVLAVLGVAALLLLGYLTVSLGDASTSAYRGGIAAASVAATVLVAAAATDGVLGRALGVPPLRWLGRRSYGLYLWHWPVIALTAATVPGWADRWPVRLAEVALAMGLAAASWRFVERPAQRAGIGASLRTLFRGLVSRGSGPACRLAPVALVTVLGLAGTGCLLAPAKTQLQARLEAGRQSLGDATERPRPTTPAATTSHAPTPPATNTQIDGQDVTAVGNSVMLGAAPALDEQLPGIYIDADEDRSMAVVPDLLAGYESDGTLRDVVVVGVADNGGVSAATIERTMNVVGEERTIVFVTTPLDDSVGQAANEALRAAARTHGNVRLAKWSTYAHHHPDRLISDGVHPRANGSKAYARLIEQAAERPRR